MERALGPRELRVVRRDRGGDDHLRADRHVPGVVPDRGLDALGAQRLHVARLGAVRSAHLGAERARDEREAAHPRPPDADEVKPPSAPRTRGHEARLAVMPG